MAECHHALHNFAHNIDAIQVLIGKVSWHVEMRVQWHEAHRLFNWVSENALMLFYQITEIHMVFQTQEVQHFARHCMS